MIKHVHTEVKCHHCARICGEIEGSRPARWVLYSVDRVVPVVGCGVTSRADLRCSRCGGRVYADETYAGVGDTHVSRTAASHPGGSQAAA